MEQLEHIAGFIGLLGIPFLIPAIPLLYFVHLIFPKEVWKKLFVYPYFSPIELGYFSNWWSKPGATLVMMSMSLGRWLRYKRFGELELKPFVPAYIYRLSQLTIILSGVAVIFFMTGTFIHVVVLIGKFFLK